MDPELREFLEQRLGSVEERFASVDERLTAHNAELRRYFYITVEDFRSQTQRLAEGIAVVAESLERFKADVDRRFEESHAFTRLLFGELKAEMGGLKADVDRRFQESHASTQRLIEELAGDMNRRFEENYAFMRVSFADLASRLPPPG